MIGLGLRQVEKALDSKADAIQREFIAAGDELDDLGRKLLEANPENRMALDYMVAWLLLDQRKVLYELLFYPDLLSALHTFLLKIL